MNSSWPILFGFLVMVVAAFWYDAAVAPERNTPAAAAPATQPR